MSTNAGMQFPDTPHTGSFYSDTSVTYRWQTVSLRQGHSFQCAWRGECARCKRAVWMALDGRWYEALGRHQGFVYEHPEFGPIQMCASCSEQETYMQMLLNDLADEGSSAHSEAAAGHLAPYVWKKLDQPTKKKEKVA